MVTHQREVWLQPKAQNSQFAESFAERHPDFSPVERNLPELYRPRFVEVNAGSRPRVLSEVQPPGLSSQDGGRNRERDRHVRHEDRRGGGGRATDPVYSTERAPLRHSGQGSESGQSAGACSCADTPRRGVLQCRVFSLGHQGPVRSFRNPGPKARQNLCRGRQAPVLAPGFT